MIILDFFSDFDFFLPWFIFGFFFGVILGEPISNESLLSVCWPFELFPKLAFFGTTLFRLEDRTNDEVVAEVGLEGPEPLGEVFCLGRDFDRFNELNERDRLGDLGLVGDTESSGEFGREFWANDELGLETGQLWDSGLGLQADPDLDLLPLRLPEPFFAGTELDLMSLVSAFVLISESFTLNVEMVEASCGSCPFPEFLRANFDSGWYAGEVEASDVEDIDAINLRDDKIDPDADEALVRRTDERSDRVGLERLKQTLKSIIHLRNKNGNIMIQMRRWLWSNFTVGDWSVNYDIISQLNLQHLT